MKLLAVLLMTLPLYVACEREGPFERAAEEVDRGWNEVDPRLGPAGGEGTCGLRRRVLVVRRAEEVSQEKMGKLTAGMPMPPGMKFPF